MKARIWHLFAILIILLLLGLVSISPEPLSATAPSGDDVVESLEPSLWDSYWGWIIGGLALLGLQSGFIGALLLNRARRQRAEQGLQERLQFEEVLSGLSAAFVNLPPDQIAHEIDAWLTKILDILSLERITVLEFSEDKEQFLTLHSSTAPGIADFPRQVPTETLPWFSRTVSQGEKLAYSHLPDDLPPDAVQEKEYCRREGLKSIISLPLQVGGSVLGVINFSKLREYLDWGSYPLVRLNLVAEIFANALMRQRTQQALEDRLGLEGLLTELSAAFVNLPVAQVESEIKNWHGRVIDFLKVERSIVVLFAPNENELHILNVHTIAGSGGPDFKTITPEVLPWYFQQVYGGKTLVLSRLPEDLPGELLKEKDYCLRTGLKSFVGVPMAAGGEVLGTITMGFFSRYVEWPPYLINRLQLAGEIFANALSRQRKEAALQQAELRNRIIADFTYDWEYWENPDGGLNYVSPACERISGYPAEEFLARPQLLGEIILPDDRKIWDDHREEIRQTPAPHEIQFRILRSDGESRWLEHACGPVYGSNGEFLGFRASNRDINTRKLTELEIERLKEQLQADYSYLQEEIKLTHDFEHIIGNSNELKYVLHKVEQVAPSDTTVLILGETGTGKELIARAVHSSSPRRHRPLVKVDCASLSPNLIESELFGHEKGAFTGAQSRKIGRFELAHGSTLFLDEIGELPLELQTKLLRLVQEGEFERLGSSQPLKVDVRIIAATNRDLEEEVRKGRFREDLWFRLHVFPITLPPLRQRQEDIPLLVQSFVQRFSRKMGKEITKISPHVLEALRRYPWPGNVRELENVIERAVIDTKGPVLQLAAKISASQSPASAFPSESLEAVERAHILQVLEKVGWKIEGKDGAAARLELNPSTLRFRIRKLNIVRHS